MIPFIDPAILEFNPHFAFVHKHLTTKLLNPDASTRVTAEPHATVSAALHPHLLRAAKEELLRSSLRNISTESKRKADSGVSVLPLELRDSVGTTSMLLDGATNLTLSAEDYDLLAPEIDAFHDNIGAIASALSGDLQRQHDVLCKMAAAGAGGAGPSLAQAPPLTRNAATSKRSLRAPTASTIFSSATSSLPPPPPPPPPPSGSLQTLLQPLLTSPNSLLPLQASLQDLASTTLQHMHVHRTLLSATLTHLELTTYGLQARHAKARSAHLKAVATALEARIRVQCLQCRNKLYQTDVQSALGNYQRHLTDVEAGLVERKATLRGLLDEYDAAESLDGRGGGGVVSAGKGQNGLMREVAKRYGEVLREVELVKWEIEKLERGERETKGDRSRNRVR